MFEQRKDIWITGLPLRADGVFLDVDLFVRTGSSTWTSIDDGIVRDLGFQNLILLGRSFISFSVSSLRSSFFSHETFYGSTCTIVSVGYCYF